VQGYKQHCMSATTWEERRELRGGSVDAQTSYGRSREVWFSSP
jgi:hypothetical protein